MGRTALMRTSSRRARGLSSRPPSRTEALVALFDDDPVHFTVEEWRRRNLEMYAELETRGLIDPAVVPFGAHRFLTEALIRDDNPAATDPQNAGHVRAQNENILHFGLSVGAPRTTLTIALEAGFIHDLNKSVSAPLRHDRWAVRTQLGAIHPEMRTVAESVGLNHLGEGTRASVIEATLLEEDPLPDEVAMAIDACIVHHGLGSSRFIRQLIDGDNEWWGGEFVDSQSGIRRLIHPAQPPLTLQSLLHDLADSSQQMEGGVAWLFKYPGGFWRDSGRSYWQMLSDPEHTGSSIPMSLKVQIQVETETCRRIIRDAHLEGLIGDAEAGQLDLALKGVVRRTAAWIDDDPHRLSRPGGTTLYHDLARALGTSPARVLSRLKDAGPSHPSASELEALLWSSARRVDLRRTRDLVRLIERATVKPPVSAPRAARGKARGKRATTARRS